MGPNLKNCPVCGRIFAAQGRNICNKCLEKEDVDFAIVRAYVRENPGASVSEVAEATEVAEDKILQFMRDGRLIIKSLSTSTMCAHCGKTISSGRFCKTCLAQLGAEIKGVVSAVSRPQEESPPAIQLRGKPREKMHIKEDD